jgi:glycosyltransferase involved in cell wall biosynthesis
MAPESRLSVAIGPVPKTGGVRTNILWFRKYSGHRIHLIPYSRFSPFYPGYRGLGAALHRHPALPRFDAYGIAYRCLFLRGFDVVHTHAHPVWPAPYAPTDHPRRIHTVHQLYSREDASNERHWQLLTNLNEEMIAVCRASRLVIAVSRVLADELRARYGISAEIVPNGIEFDAVRGLQDSTARPAPGAPDFLFVGHAGRVKRPDLFMRLAAAMPNRRFVMIGPGLDPLALSAQWGRLPANLVARGPLDNQAVRNLMGLSRVVVITSERETSSLVLLEALASGARIVVPRLPALQELLPQGFPAFPVGQFSALEELAASAWEASPSDTFEVKRLLEEHDVRRLAARIDGLYRTVVEAGP